MSRRLGIGAFALVLAVMLILPVAAFAAPVRVEDTAFDYFRADGTPADIAAWPAAATWMTYSDPGMSPGGAAGGNHFSGTAGAYAEVTFEGTAVTYISTKGPNRGNAEVYLDGVLQTTVNQYDPAVVYQQVLWSTSGLSAGNHTLKIVALGTGAPPYNYAEIDAIEYEPVPEVTETPASSAWSVGALALVGLGAVLAARRRLAG